ncbi:hypothetical protein ACXZ66_09715 [Corynebacterium sp. S7]
MSSPSNSRFKIPAAVHYVGFAVLLAAAIVAIVLLARHEATAVNRPGKTAGVEWGYQDIPADPNQTLAQVQPWLISNAEVSDTHSGLKLTGTLTQDAELNPNTVTGHINALLFDNCISAMSLQTQENMQFDAYGYCHSGMDPAALSSLYKAALANNADALMIADFPTEVPHSRAQYVWFANTTEEMNAIIDSWDSLAKTMPTLRLVTFVVYGPDDAQMRDFWWTGS